MNLSQSLDSKELSDKFNQLHNQHLIAVYASTVFDDVTRITQNTVFFICCTKTSEFIPQPAIKRFPMQFKQFEA